VARYDVVFTLQGLAKLIDHIDGSVFPPGASDTYRDQFSTIFFESAGPCRSKDGDILYKLVDFDEIGEVFFNLRGQSIERS